MAAIVFQASPSASVHSYAPAELIALSQFINQELGALQLGSRLPVDTSSLFVALADGVLLLHLAKLLAPQLQHKYLAAGAAPGLNSLSPFEQNELLDLALKTARQSGCVIEGIGASDIRAGAPHLILAVLWQMARARVLQNVDLRSHRYLLNLRIETEAPTQFVNLAPLQLLLRWVNFHLAQAQFPRTIQNFGADLRDSLALLVLMYQLQPQQPVNIQAYINHPDMTERARGVEACAHAMQVSRFVSVDAILAGKDDANLAFVADLCGKWPGSSLMVMALR